MTPGRAGSSVVAVLSILCVAAAGCTGVRVREFSRDWYEPAASLTPVSRVVAAEPAAVWTALVHVLTSRGARFEEQDVAAGRLRVSLPWATAQEAAACVDLGRVRRVVTLTERRYRSYSPFDYDCNACVVRNGKVTYHHTELVLDEILELDPGLYRIDARIGAVVAPAPEGTWLELSLELAPAPREPPEMLARSRGRLEEVLLSAVAERLQSDGSDLR